MVPEGRPDVLACNLCAYCFSSISLVQLAVLINVSMVNQDGDHQLVSTGTAVFIWLEILHNGKIAVHLVLFVYIQTDTEGQYHIGMIVNLDESFR